MKQFKKGHDAKSILNEPSSDDTLVVKGKAASKRLFPYK